MVELLALLNRINFSAPKSTFERKKKTFVEKPNEAKVFSQVFGSRSVRLAFPDFYFASVIHLIRSSRAFESHFDESTSQVYRQLLGIEEEMASWQWSGSDRCRVFDAFHAL